MDEIVWDINSTTPIHCYSQQFIISFKYTIESLIELDEYLWSVVETNFSEKRAQFVDVYPEFDILFISHSLLSKHKQYQTCC